MRISSNAHTHTQFGDGRSTAEEIVRRALELGFTSLGFSEHADTEIPVDWNAYIAEIDRLKAACGDRLRIRTGIELDRLSDVNPSPFEYYIAANHYFLENGDLAAIGTAETVHSAARGENITIIFVNNAIYGMTGGQMAPTTLIGQKTTTSPDGRDEAWCGAPIKMSEMLAAVPSSYYIERVAVNNTANINKAKKAIAKAFRYQKEGKGFCMVEVLSTCPTNWGMSPVEAMTWLEENMIPYYPLGVYKDKEAK